MQNFASFVNLTSVLQVNNISVATIQNMDDLSKIFSEFILKSSRPVCMSWLRNELSMENNDSSKVLLGINFSLQICFSSHFLLALFINALASTFP